MLTTDESQVRGSKARGKIHLTRVPISQTSQVPGTSRPLWHSCVRPTLTVVAVDGEGEDLPERDVAGDVGVVSFVRGRADPQIHRSTDPQIHSDPAPAISHLAATTL